MGGGRRLGEGGGRSGMREWGEKLFATDRWESSLSEMYEEPSAREAFVGDLMYGGQQTLRHM